MKVMTVLLLGVTLATGAAARQADDPLAGRAAGKPVPCIDIDRVRGPEIIDDHTILYRENGRRTWRATIVGSCPSLRPLTTLIVEVHASQLCRDDHFRVLEPGTMIPSAICRFGGFVPYDKGAK